MSKTIRGILAFLTLCGLSFLLLNCGSTVNRTSGLLYVLIQGTNQVSSYAINLTSGNLSLINSNASTCASGQSCGLALNIILDSAESNAFVLNQGPVSVAQPPVGVGVPSIYGYKVNSDGSLANGSDLTTNSGYFVAGDLAIAMTRDPGGKFLFVITQGLVSPPANCPSAGCPLLYVFSTQSGSTGLTLAGTSCPGTTTPPPCQLSRIPTGIAAVKDPNSSNVILYVTSSSDLKTGEHVDNTLSEYAVDGSGNLTEHLNPDTGFPYVTPGTPNSALAVQTAPIGGASGLFVYVASATSNDVSAYQLCTVQNANCTQQDVSVFKLLPVGSTSTVGSDPVAMVVDPTKSFLYVISRNSSQVFGFRINATQGTLTALSPANLSTGLEPVAIAMHSTGQFIFVSNNGSANLSSYVLNTTSGEMSSPLTITSLGNPAGLVSK
jgi:6-phosphogluconolactonase (cycloisomerase 2 family)